MEGIAQVLAAVQAHEDLDVVGRRKKQHPARSPIMRIIRPILEPLKVLEYRTVGVGIE